MPWLPVGFGLGIVVYFSADWEQVWWVAAMLAALVATAALTVSVSRISWTPAKSAQSTPADQMNRQRALTGKDRTWVASPWAQGDRLAPSLT